jgi:hypothetical protein
MTLDWPDNEMLEAAWGIIANAHGGNWDEASDEWKEAAENWRDAYHRYLDKTGIDLRSDVAESKYMVFKREDFYQMMGELALPPGSGAPEDMDCAPIAQHIQGTAEATRLQDAVVIRRQDVFAPPALDAYSNAIMTTVEGLKAFGFVGSDTVKRLRMTADYFHQEATASWDTDRKLPD